MCTNRKGPEQIAHLLFVDAFYSYPFFKRWANVGIQLQRYGGQSFDICTFSNVPLAVWSNYERMCFYNTVEMSRKCHNHRTQPINDTQRLIRVVSKLSNSFGAKFQTTFVVCFFIFNKLSFGKIFICFAGFCVPRVTAIIVYVLSRANRNPLHKLLFYFKPSRVSAATDGKIWNTSQAH